MAKDVNMTPIFSSDYLINGVYRDIYFDLDRVKDLPHPEKNWWSSAHRYSRYRMENGREVFSENGTTAEEYLEIDLGRIRQINFMSFDIIRVPVDVTIEYDAISDGSGTKVWSEVQRFDQGSNLPFDSVIAYSAGHKSAWFNAQFYLATLKGQIINTRYLRLKFTRKDSNWPLSNSAQFKYPVSVRNFRCGRFIRDIEQTAGPLILSGFERNPVIETADSIAGNKTREVRQRFCYPSDAKRGNITPNILGFGFGVDVPETFFLESDNTSGKLLADASWEWSIYNVTDPTLETLLLKGKTGEALQTDKNWIDVYFPEHLIAGDLDSIYELRIKSTNATVSQDFYIHEENLLNAKEIADFDLTNGSNIFEYTPDTSSSLADADDFNAVLQAGDFIRVTNDTTSIYEIQSINTAGSPFQVTVDANFNDVNGSYAIEKLMPFSAWDSGTNDYVTDKNKSLVMRIWTDTADDGQDVIDNPYRYGTYRDEASRVFDKTKLGWISAPKPTPNAVEALYFDVRTRDNLNDLVPTTIDGMKIAPETPGVHMHVYYVEEYTATKKPQTETEWNHLVWTPINQSYLLRGQAIFDFPSKIRASMIKLEFSNLSPRPFEIPTYPKLPPIHYKRYPSWVDAKFDNAERRYRRVVEDWFIRTYKNLTISFKKQAKTELEFQKRERVFLRELSLGNLKKDKKLQKSKLFDLKQGKIIDPVMAQTVFIRTYGMWGNNLLNTTDQNSLLAGMVVNQAAARVGGNPIERQINFSNTTTASPTVSSINDRISESYAHIPQSPRWFNEVCMHRYKEEKAYFNGVAYFVGISEIEFLKTNFQIVHDDPLIDDLLENSSFTETNTFVATDQTRIEDGQTVYMSYTVGGVKYTDEEITLGSNVPSALFGIGDVAIDKRMFELPDQKGTEYFIGRDYTFGYEKDLLGNTINTIARYGATERYIVPEQEGGGRTRRDSNTVSVFAIPSSVDEFVPDNIPEEFVDAGTVTATTTASGVETLFGSGDFGGGSYG